jgi:hypothetical protein
MEYKPLNNIVRWSLKTYIIVFPSALLLYVDTGDKTLPVGHTTRPIVASCISKLLLSVVVYVLGVHQPAVLCNPLSIIFTTCETAQ